MSIYEIEQAILDCIDPETGEISDFEKLEALNMERDEKFENIALWIKNLVAEARAIREEELALAARRQSVEKKTDSLKSYLQDKLGGEAFKTSKVDISYRKSAAVEIEDEAEFVKLAPEELLTRKEPTINKKEVTAAIKSGLWVPGAALVERQNMQIK